MLDINVSEKLLIQFSQFKPTGRKPTWMEICSFPQQRFEEICSRILRFFLNPDNPHGLKDLFIRSFEQCLSEKCLSDVIHEFEKTDENEHVLTRGPNGTLRLYSIPEYERFIERIKSYPDKRKLDTFKRGLNLRLIDCLVDQKQQFLDIDNSFCIQCEVVTEQQNRIDLLISCSSWVACIENKIFANIQNPLDDYEDYVDKLFGNSRAAFNFKCENRNAAFRKIFIVKFVIRVTCNGRVIDTFNLRVFVQIFDNLQRIFYVTFDAQRQSFSTLQK